MQINAGDTVTFAYGGNGHREERKGKALSGGTERGLWVTADEDPEESQLARGKVPNCIWVRPSEVIEVRSRATEERLAGMKEALGGLLKYGGDTVRTVAGTSFFKKSSGVRR